MKLTMDIIRLSDVLEQMDNTSVPFDITYCTADEKKDTGGEIKAYQNCKQTGAGRQVAKAKAAEKPAPEPKTKLSKNPNHFQNATRNIILPNGKTRTVCIYLIMFFNGKKVII